MALDHDTNSAAAAREALQDDPDFLCTLVELAPQRFLDAEMNEHEAILQALRERDPSGAERAASDHIQNVIQHSACVVVVGLQ